MDNNTNWTLYPDDNLPGFTDSNQINESEAEGITRAELFVFELDSEEPISTWLITAIHKLAFGHLYDWADKWRTTLVRVGQLEPPQPN